MLPGISVRRLRYRRRNAIRPAGCQCGRLRWLHDLLQPALRPAALWPFTEGESRRIHTREGRSWLPDWFASRLSSCLSCRAASSSRTGRAVCSGTGRFLKGIPSYQGSAEQSLIPWLGSSLLQLGSLPALFWLIVSILEAMGLWLHSRFCSSSSEQHSSSHSWLHPRAPLLNPRSC